MKDVCWPAIDFLSCSARRACLVTGAVAALLAVCGHARLLASNQMPVQPSTRGAPGLWRPVAEATLDEPERTWRIESGKYRTFRLDRDRFAALLAPVPREHSEEAKNRPVQLELPLPDGSFASFRVEEESMAGPAGQCPELRAYRGRTPDGVASVRFQWSSSGIHAVVSSERDVVHIRPHSPGDTEHYIVYHARDWRSGGAPTELAPDRSPGADPSDVPSSPHQPGIVEEISIDRRCFRCENQYTLTFRRDGMATLTVVGVLGEDHTCSGRITPDDFAGVAGLLQTHGFFDLNEAYRDPQLADGVSMTTSAVVDGRRKAVMNSNEAGPPGLKAIERAIADLAAKIVWTTPRR